MNKEEYFFKTSLGENLLNYCIKTLEKRSSLLNRLPLISSYIAIFFWLLGITLRLTVSRPIVTTLELVVSGSLFILLTLTYQFFKWRTSILLLMILTVVQAMIMGLNSELIFVGSIWLVLFSLMLLGYFKNSILKGLHGISNEYKSNSNENEIKNKSLKTTYLCISLSFLALIIFSYMQPGLGDNQQVFFGTAHISSFYDNLYDKFSNVWEMKPIFHRAYVYTFYEIANNFSDFHDKASFEKAVYISYGLWCALIISIGILAGYKKLASLFKVPLWVMLLIAISIQGVMPAKAFEAEEMVYSFSILSIGLMLSSNPILVFFSPLIFLYITLLKGVTLLIPVSLVLFSLLLFKFKKSDYLSFVSGSIFAILLLVIFFIKYPIFLHEYSNAGAIQQSTVLFSGWLRLTTSIGAISKSLYNNPFIFSGLLLSLPLFSIFKKRKEYRYFAAFLILWLGMLMIPVVLGKAFTYYAMPLSISTFFTILMGVRLLSDITQEKEYHKTLKKHLIISSIIVALVVLSLGKPIVIFASLFIFLLPIFISQILKSSSKTTFTPIHFLLIIISVTLIAYITLRRPWNLREASYMSDKPQIVNFLKNDDPNYLKNEMLYLSYGREAYHLGLYTPSRYFYTLVMRRHMEMEKVINSDKPIFKYFKKSAKQGREIIVNSDVMKETIEDILNYKGEYIIRSKRGWCNLSLYPSIKKHLDLNYKKAMETHAHEIYVKN